MSQHLLTRFSYNPTGISARAAHARASIVDTCGMRDDARNTFSTTPINSRSRDTRTRVVLARKVRGVCSARSSFQGTAVLIRPRAVHPRTRVVLARKMCFIGVTNRALGSTSAGVGPRAGNYRT